MLKYASFLMEPSYSRHLLTGFLDIDWGPGQLACPRLMKTTPGEVPAAYLEVPVCWQVRAGSGPWARFFARLCLAGLPRGGGDGDAIRMGILHIMRENGIREGHRPVQPTILE